jgi:hypothetical protein
MWARPMGLEFGPSGQKSQCAEWLNLGGLKLASPFVRRPKKVRADIDSDHACCLQGERFHMHRLHILGKNEKVFPVSVFTPGN